MHSNQRMSIQTLVGTWLSVGTQHHYEDPGGDLRLETRTKKTMINIALKPFPRDLLKISRETTKQQVEDYLHTLVWLSILVKLKYVAF